MTARRANIVPVLLLMGLLLVACSQASLSATSTTTGVKTPSVPTVTVDPSPASNPLPTPLPTTRPRRLQPGDLQLAADIDDIPAIFADDTIFVDAATGSHEWLDEELVIGLALNDDARAYPIRLLSLHEIVNDTVGGRPVAVTWCPLCFSALVFDRIVGGVELTFGVSGFLYNNNLVMYDHRSNTFWSQLLGEAIRGGYKGERLAILPSQMTTWEEWKMLYPDTRVLSAAQLGRRAEDVIDPYAGYYNSGAAGIAGWETANDLLPAKALVVGLTAADEARAYSLETIAAEEVINDQLGVLPVLLVYAPELRTAITYHRELAGHRLTFRWSEAQPGLLEDEETGSFWSVDTGLATSGPLAGQRLSRLSGPLVYWFAWSDFHPASEVYTPQD